MPIEETLGDIPKVVMRESAVDAVCHGRGWGSPGSVAFSEGIKKDDPVALLSAKRELVAIGKALMSADEIQSQKRGSPPRPSGW